MNSDSRRKCMTDLSPHVKCTQCGADNYGSHAHCLLCRSVLPMAAIPRPSNLAGGMSEVSGKVCHACKSPVMNSSARFCHICGAMVQEVVQQVKIPTPTCTNPACRRELPPGTVFCSFCGQRATAGTLQSPSGAHPASNPPPARQNVVNSAPAQCPRCQRPIPVGKNFCTGCGTRVM